MDRGEKATKSIIRVGREFIKNFGLKLDLTDRIWGVQFMGQEKTKHIKLHVEAQSYQRRRRMVKHPT